MAKRYYSILLHRIRDYQIFTKFFELMINQPTTYYNPYCKNYNVYIPSYDNLKSSQKNVSKIIIET